jgi:glycosyltransferase involved in cell wall biosynthesis
MIGERTGVGSYAANLVRGLAEIDNENEYLLYPYFWECFPPQWRSVQVPQKPNFQLWGEDLPLEEIHRRWATEKTDEVTGGVNVLHSTAFTVPAFHKTKLVVTVHDLTFLTHPHLHTPANREFCLKQIERLAERAALVIADSYCTKKDLLQYLAIPEERVTVVHLAAGEDFHLVQHEETMRQVLAKYEIFHNYLLFVGSLEPRKNVLTLLRAAADILKSAKPPYLLVIAGASGWLNSEVFQEVQSLGLRERVKFLGYVPDVDLRALYSAARIFIYPSLYEGFGLPVLEAMACGAPVITANTSSLPEVAGEAALLVPPTDVGALKQAIEAVLSDQHLRLRLRQQSLKQAARFSWRESARRTLEVYKRVAGMLQ